MVSWNQESGPLRRHCRPIPLYHQTRFVATCCDASFSLATNEQHPYNTPIGAFLALFWRSMKNNKVTIKIPRPLYTKIQQLINDSGFNSPTDFVVYVLRDVISESGTEERESFSPEELSVLKKKLRNLGYLD